MMKWITLALSFLFNKPSKGLNFKDMALEIFDDIMARGRKPIALILLGFASILLICGGILMALIDATRQYDAGGSIYFGAVFWSGLIMTVVFLAGYVYVFLRVWPGVKHQKEKRKAQQDEERAKHPLGLDEALSLLIMDHIEERRSRRAQHQEERGKTSTASSSSKSSSQEHRGGMPPTGFA